MKIVIKDSIVLFMALLLLLSSVEINAQETVLTYVIGDCRVSILSDGGNNAGSSLLKGATPEILEKYLPDGSFLLETQAFLIRFPDKNVLIDAGTGKNLAKNLQSLKVPEEQIQIILLTHMHGDHIGGLLREGKKVFPQAELYVSQAEYDYWMDANERGENARKVLEAYKDKLHLFVAGEPESEIPDLISGVKPVAAYGHTPGHTAFLLESAGQKLLVWGDIAHAMDVQMPCPEVALTFDVNPQQAIQTRKKILEFVSKNKISISGAHIKLPAIGNIKVSELEGYVFTPLCTCLAI
ncbi:MAG: MBL fold metallo-hydrolase [Prevotellaceae bacterium]|jgi:glyoxylase-like metal-dependent hydrolase (beta-lactamase superfamily II)|nr:MBL fold metallo-hydrolase [Prevotellaceae bacterium]